MERLLTWCGHVKVHAWTVDPATGTEVSLQVANLLIATYDFDYGPGTVTLDLEDWTAAVGRALIPGLWAPVSGTTPLQIGAAVRALINDAFPTGLLDAALPPVPIATSVDNATLTKAGLSFSGSRLDAISDLLLPDKKVLYCTSTGSFAARTSAALGAPASVVPVQAVSYDSRGDGELDGNLVDYQTAPADNGGYNAVAIAWSSADGASFGTVFLVDTVGGFGTEYTGPFGHRVRPTETVDSVETEAAAILVAEGRLAEVLRRNRRATVTFTLSPRLVPDDYLHVKFPREATGITTETHEITSVSHDTGSGLTTVETAITGFTYL
jgi:hypothetical protein